MLPGPAIVRKCSVCSRPILQLTIESGNTFGATFWTDGKCDAPMLPDMPWLVMCPHCKAPLWIDELEELGEIWDEFDDGCEHGFKGALIYLSLSLDDYLALLANGIASTGKERYVRMRAWWAGNDARRGLGLAETADTPISAEEASNLSALAMLLDESDPEDLVMKAEVMRELGRFDAARMLLEKPIGREWKQTASFIRKLAENADPYVRVINNP